MELTHRFTVPGPVEETWERFGDIASLAECFPGAQVTSFSGDSFEGTVKVKLGPIALVYAGSGSFVDKDETAHSFVVEAKGRDKRGNGTAGATVTVSMAGSGGDSTEVEVKTDLSITGKPAQFGRGVMQDVSDKLLGQFVACLEKRSAAAPETAAEETAAEETAAEETDQDAGPASVPTGAAASGSPGDDPDTGPASAPAPAPDSGESASPPSVSTAAAPPPPAAADDALDLGATVLPVLARAYWRQAAGALLGLLVLWRILRTLRR
jgi:carbon monoxide dehydrogenase subunit G